MKNVLFCIALILAAASVQTAYAWDDVGHKITAYIAWQRMSPQARENVIKILRAAPEDSQLATFYMVYGPQPEETRKREYFMTVATWADIVRDRSFENRYKTYHHGNWHYDDIFWRQEGAKVVPLTGFDEGGLAVTKLVEFDKVVRDPAASARDKALAIAWIMHSGGDIHQPLHTSARVTDTEPKGDQGGNLFHLTPKGTPREEQVNLHWFWDSIVGRNIPIRGEECDREYIEPIAESLMQKYPFAELQGTLNVGNYEEWKKQSFALNPTDVFTPELKRSEMPSPDYKRNAFRVSERQLALAGYRLGETLNSIFSAPAAGGAK